MALKDTFVSVLKNAYAARIDFNYVATTGTVLSLRGAHFSQIGNLISKGTLDVQTDATLPAGIAKYTALSGGDATANTFYVCSAPPRGRLFEGLIVHEAVHAVFDIYQTTVEWIDNEAIAYIAQGFYLKFVGFDENNLSSVSQPYFGLQLAKSVSAEGVLDDFWLQALRESLSSDPLYHDYIRKTFRGDG
jgi:hypothetical protein